MKRKVISLYQNSFVTNESKKIKLINNDISELVNDMFDGIKQRITDVIKNELNIIELEEEKNNKEMISIKNSVINQFDNADIISLDVWRYILSFITMNRTACCLLRKVCKEFNKFSISIAKNQIGSTSIKSSLYVKLPIYLKGINEIFHYFRRNKNDKYCYLCGESGHCGYEKTNDDLIVNKYQQYCRDCLLKYCIAISNIKNDYKVKLSQTKIQSVLFEQCKSSIRIGNAKYYFKNTIDELVINRKLF